MKKLLWMLLAILSAIFLYRLGLGVYQQAVGGAYGDMIDKGVDQNSARIVAYKVGIVGVTLFFAIPALLWTLILRPWKPRSRSAYAWRFSLWPFVVTSIMLGNTIARAVYGISSPYQSGVWGMFEAFLMLPLISLPIFWSIGYAVSKKRFSPQP